MNFPWPGEEKEFPSRPRPLGHNSCRRDESTRERVISGAAIGFLPGLELREFSSGIREREKEKRFRQPHDFFRGKKRPVRHPMEHTTR